MEKKYEIDMCNGPILTKMLRFAVPLMFSSILQLLFNAADIVVVGKFAGDNSLGAVGSTSALINLLINVFVGLSVGANVVAARHYGAEDNDGLSKTVHTSMLISLISGVFLAVVGFFGAEFILELMQTPPGVLPLATLYLKIYFLGMPALMVYDFGSALLRSIGDTKRPLYFLVCAGIVNVGLNLLFVIVFKMDVAGVAIATVISQTISAVLVVICLVKSEGAIRLDFRKLRIDKNKLKGILQVGLPAGFQGMLFSLSNVVIQSSVNLFGNTVVAGNSAAMNIEGFIYVSMNAFHQAVVAFCSANYGAGKIKRINKIVFTGVMCATVTGLLIGGVGLIFGRQLLGIYSDGAATIDAGMVRMNVIMLTHFLCGIMDVMVGGLRGIGYSIMPMIVSLLGACGLRLLWIATVFQIPEFHNVVTIYVSYPISWAVTALVHIICYIWAKKRVNKRFDNIAKKAA